MSMYEIYALKYAGPFVRSWAFLMWLRDWERTEMINYYIWCLKGPDETVVVDAGVAPDMARERELEGYVSPAEVLSRIGVKAEDVRHIIITHMHWDHVSGVTLFPNATFYVQEMEYSFWMHDPVAKKPPFIELLDEDSRASMASLEGTGRLVLVEGDREILHGVRCILAPGHTPALQALAVSTARGTAVLGSDCAHLFQNYRERWPSVLITDMAAWLKSYDKLASIASAPDLLFPGHDTRMLQNYPQIAEDIARLV